MPNYSIDDLLKSPFEKIKRISEDGYEYWSTRDLYKLLEYSEYRHFLPVIDKVKSALINLDENGKCPYTDCKCNKSKK